MDNYKLSRIASDCVRKVLKENPMEWVEDDKRYEVTVIISELERASPLTQKKELLHK